MTHSLDALRSEVLRTRTAERAAQGRHGINADSLATARSATLRALEDFAAALEDRGWPVPPVIQRDLQLLRALSSIPRR
ncbi:MAG TPA: hypothetical protein VLI04_22085 [Nocardioidaceae bacterium]|nr:hypothetical protein [Nocardioidaceae bacterium]